MECQQVCVLEKMKSMPTQTNCLATVCLDRRNLLTELKKIADTNELIGKLKLMKDGEYLRFTNQCDQEKRSRIKHINQGINNSLRQTHPGANTPNTN